MSSIWDTPNPDGVGKTIPAAKPQAPVASGLADRTYGREDGRQLLTAQGRGVVNGVPYGENELNRENSLEQRYRLQPSTLARVRASFRSVFGR